MTDAYDQRRGKLFCAGSLSKYRKGRMQIHNSLPDKRCRIRQLVSPRHYIDPGRRVSLSAARKASLTVEAAWAVPLFFLAAVCLISMTELYGMYAEKVVRQQEKAETAAMYGSLAGEYAIAAIDLRDSFTYRPRWYPEALPGVRVSARGRVRPWTGRADVGEGAAEEDDADELVYVTEYESVYHTSSQCTHLALTVNAVSGSKVGSMHNDHGERYHACEKCVGSGGRNSTVYITPEGDHYHNSAECSGLKRTTKLVKRSETGGLHMCSRCQAMEGAA